LAQAKIGDAKDVRNYAIILLALHTGLRMIDIVHLKLNDIDWYKKELNIVQHKTDNALNLPLQPDAGNAIADYILNFRPAENNSPYVFLKTVAPIGKLTDNGTGINILKPYLRELSSNGHQVSGKGFHALRRSMGTWLIESGSDVSVAAQVLGHKDHNSSKRYISLHYSGLHCCCMSLSGIETVREGLR
jgi:integrase